MKRLDFFFEKLLIWKVFKKIVSEKKGNLGLELISE